MPPPANVKTYTVSAVTTAVKARIEEHFASFWVTGEVSSFTRASSGHVYFTLKDANSQLKCVMFRGIALRVSFDMADGMQVIARGGLTVYAPRGDYQLQVEELHPKGVGAAELALRKLKEKLLTQGYFDPRRKRSIARFPKRIALIASASGAAIRDMLELLIQRWPMTHVIVRPSLVQGPGAAEAIAGNLQLLNKLHRNGDLPLDAIVIGRGGGSVEDLWVFNAEVLANAIFQSAVPVVSAVGHEIDVTIADLVADQRAETPSAAIVALTPHQKDVRQYCQDSLRRLHEAMQQRLEISQQRLKALATRPALRKPIQRVRELEQKLDDYNQRLARGVRRVLQRHQDRLQASTEQLESLSPLNVLRRGYSLTRRGDGNCVREARDVSVGEVIQTTLSQGSLLSRVLSVELASGEIATPMESAE